MSGKKQRKEKRKQKQITLRRQKKETSEKFPELLEVLDELGEKEKCVDVQICPQCKSPRVRRVRSNEGDMSAHIGVLPAKFECVDCGWRERVVLKATNRKLGWKEVAIIAEASGNDEPLSPSTTS